MQKIKDLGQNLATNAWRISSLINEHQKTTHYDAALHLFKSHIRNNFEELARKNPTSTLYIVNIYLDPTERISFARKLSKDRNLNLRKQAINTLVNLKEDPGSLDWFDKLKPGRLRSHQHGPTVQAENGLPIISTIGDLRKLFGIKSSTQLGWLLTASPSTEVYETFTIPKSNGTTRVIEAPRPQLKKVQRQILDLILAKIPVHQAANGFVSGKSTKTNADPHVGKQIIIKFDLKDFFPTVHYWRVVGLFSQLGYDPGTLKLSTEDDSRSIAPALARLTTCTSDPNEYGKGHTPQGAPTSPAILNLICRGLDSRLAGIADSLGGNYTRYADDLTFSFNTAPNIGKLKWWIDEICTQEGFSINHKKFRVFRRHKQQLVTGLVVNEHVSVPRKDRRKLRAILNNCEKFGLESQTRGKSVKEFIDYIRGWASYINMVDQKQGSKLLERVERLAGGV